jgi:dolichol-phosphate mannosyltransferase
MPDSKRLITVWVPVLNEVQNIEPLYQALLPIMDQVSARNDFEILFTDNHSTDGTFEIIERLAAMNDRVRGIGLSRNFGYSTLYLHRVT